MRRKGTLLKVKFKEPMKIDYEKASEEILAEIMDAIEQSKRYMSTVKHTDSPGVND